MVWQYMMCSSGGGWSVAGEVWRQRVRFSPWIILRLGLTRLRFWGILEPSGGSRWGLPFLDRRAIVPLYFAWLEAVPRFVSGFLTLGTVWEKAEAVGLSC